MKLQYSNEPTILRHESKKLGRTWEVAVYLPIREAKKKRAVDSGRWKTMGIRQAVFSYMKEYDPEAKGLTLLDLAIALDLMEDSIYQMFKRNPTVFYGVVRNKNKTSRGKYWVKHWYLVTPDTKEIEP